MKRRKRPRGHGQSIPPQGPRENFEAECPKCGYEWTEESVAQPTKEVKEEAPKEVGFFVRCTKTGEELIKDASCPEFVPLDPTKKKRCWNCKFHENV